MVKRIEADGPWWQSLSSRVLIWAACGAAWLFVFASTPSDAQQNAPPSSTPQALATYTQAANFQNNSAYDLAIEAWQKFLAAYPGDPKAIDAQYNLGVCLLQTKQLAEARQQLQAVVDAKQPFDRLEDAYLNLGWTLYSLALQNQPELFAQADTVFASLLEKFPQGTRRDQAWFFRGESLYLQAKRDEAVKAYQRLVDEHADSELRDDGMYALGVTYEELGDFAQAGAVYDQFLQQFGESELAGEVRLRKAETILRQGDFAKSEAEFAKLAETPGFASADHALYRQAFAVARQERFEDAGNLFARVVREFPKSQYLDDAAMAAARSYYRAERLPLAAEWFNRVLQGETDYRPEAAHWLARIMLSESDPAKALATVEPFIESSREDPFYANLLMDRADAWYEIPDRRSQALDGYAAVAAQFPESPLAPQALYNLAFGQMEAQAYDQALQSVGQFVEKYPEHRLLPDVTHVAAESRLQLGQSQQAADQFAKLVADYPDRPDRQTWRVRLALAEYVQKKYREVLQVLGSGLENTASPDDQAEAWYLVGMSHFALEQYDQAEVALTRSLEVQPKWRQADETMLNLSRTYRQREKFTEAIATVKRMLTDFPNSKLLDQGHFRWAEYAYATGDYEPAIAHYAELLEKWPDSSLAPYALYGRGWALLRANRAGEAMDSLTDLIDRFPGSPLARQAYYARAMCRQQSQQYTESLADIAHFLTLENSRSEISDAMYVRALCQIGLKQNQPAIETLESIISEDPGYASMDKVLYELGWAHRNEGRLEQAQPFFDRLAADHADSSLAAESFYHQGEQAYQANEFELASQSYAKGVELIQGNPGLDEKLRYKLGWSRFKLDDVAGAVTAFSDQVQKYPQGTLAGDAHFMLGECAFRGEKYQDALGAYQEAVKLPLSSDTMATMARLHAGQAAGQLGQWDESLKWLNELRKTYPDSPQLPAALYEIAVAQQQLGQVDEAATLFTSVADQTSGELSARARFMLGESLYAQKQYVPAIREFRKVMFGFDGNNDPALQRWQSKSAFEAGQCAGLVAAEQQNASERGRWIKLAQDFFRYVVTRHPESEEAPAATEQLKKYGA